VPYSPTFTARHNRQYRYYVSQNLLQDRAHPKHLIARLPAHEIEQVIENALRDHLPNMWPGDASDQSRDHFLRNQDVIPSQDLIREIVSKVTIDLEKVVIRFQAHGLENLTNRFFQLNLQDIQLNLQPLSIAYNTKKTERGAVVIEAEDQLRDMFAVSPGTLKKLIQGIVWRDEHFKGTDLKDIAIKYGHSEGYVGKVIFNSFETLQKHFAV